MKRRLFLAGLATAFAAGAQAPNADLLYVLPMRGGLDQFLSNQLTAAKLFRVVTDPKVAGVFLADRIGEPFERKLAELIPPPEDDKKSSESRGGGQQREHETPPVTFSSSAGKGNVFLVDGRSRQVIWSGYLKPKNNTADELNRTAKKLVERMAAELHGPKGQ